MVKKLSDPFPVQLLGNPLSISEFVKNLGVWLDSDSVLESRTGLSKRVVSILVANALNRSSLDYCIPTLIIKLPCCSHIADSCPILGIAFYTTEFIVVHESLAI